MNNAERQGNILHLIETKSRSNKATTGNKARHTYSIMLHLENKMISAGANTADVMNFERDFLEANGITVPDSYFDFYTCDSLATFIDEQLKDSKQNISGKFFYDIYVDWCKGKGLTPANKTAVFNRLRAMHIMRATGCVNGLTTHNVLIGKTIKGEYQ